MSHYLSNIASRSIGNDNYSLLPSKPVFTGNDPGIVRDFGDENNIQDNAGQNQFIQQNVVSVQPIRLQNIQQSDITNRTKTPAPEKSIELTYFSKHIERMESDQENSDVKNQPHETRSFKIEEPSRKIAVESLSFKSKVNETTFVNKTVSKIRSEKKGSEKRKNEIIASKPNEIGHDDEIIAVKKQIINPSIENEGQKIYKLPPGKSRIERIIPNQHGMENKMPIQNRIQQATPKLIIGKIIVEILPPIAPVPPKVITRVQQSTSNTGSTKSNKLSFGLGQL